MARNLAVRQFVYKYPTDKDNLPNGFYPFEDIIKNYLGGAIVSLGVQAPQGTRMYVNGELAIVGPTGVFELDNVIEITEFYLERNDNLRKVIIDMLYDKGGSNL